MGCCLSAPRKWKCWRKVKSRSRAGRGRKGGGSVHSAFPAAGSGVETSDAYVVGKEGADPGSGTRYNGEIPKSQAIESNRNISSSVTLENGTRGPALGSPSSRGSKREAFFDTEDILDNESDDEYLSVCGEFSSSTSNTTTSNTTANHGNHSAVLQRPVRTTLRTELSKVDEWMAAASAEENLPSPALESDRKIAFPYGAPNGIAALVGSPEDGVRGDEKSESARLPSKSSHILGTETRGPVKGKWERAVSDLLGRKSSGSTLSPARNLAVQSPPVAGEASRSNDHKGVFDGLCLPRLRTTAPTSRSRSLSPTSVKKRSSMMKFSLRRKASTEQHDDQDSVGISSKFYVERPLAGSQVAHTSGDRPVDGCWSEVSSTCFKVRGKHYAKDRRKIVASNFSAYVPIGVDLLMSARKMDHIAQHVELPIQDITPEADSMPPLFIVNIQLPLYPPAIFMGDTDGEGFSLVLYFKLSDDMAKAAPPYYKEIFRKFVQDELHKVKGFVGDSVLPYRDRLKVVARCVNPDEVPLSAAEKKLFATYNEKPVLSRPQHVFHKGPNYLEVDMDVHRFSYIARKGFDTFRDRLKTCVLDIGFTIQGNRQEELPEQLLAAVRLHKLDFGDYRVMHTASSPHSVKSDDMCGVPSTP